MKAVILYRPNTEEETSVQEYVRDFERQTSGTIELIDVNTPDGTEQAELYDVMQFPTLVVLNDDGQFIQAWSERDKWPTYSELSFYN